MSRAPLPLKLVPDDGAMYASAPKVYPHEVPGRFAHLRKLAAVVLLGIFYGLPWMEWNGAQAVLFDLPARKFHLFGLVLWPQDFPYLAALLVMAGLALFFFTALAGRLWCGYACPQTVWTEAFLWIEQRVEGTRNQRMKLDAAPWTARKLGIKATKHVLWLVLALWTGFTFVGFFTPIASLGSALLEFRASGWELFWLSFYAFATWGNAGFLREQVCKYMCPYARFQGSMFDRDTLLIAYDEKRGEPRGRSKRAVAARSAEAARQIAEPHPLPSPASRGGGVEVGLQPTQELIEAGDCIDCNLCVQVCPTGIDIRNGLQYDCIACGACIDACDSVMDKLARPRGLIRYTTQRSLAGAATRVLRPRVLIYGTLLATILGAWTWSLATRVPLLVDVLRDRNALYRIASDGVVENAYTLKVMNKDVAPHRYAIALAQGDGLAIAGAPLVAEVPAGGMANVAVTLRAQPGGPSLRNVEWRVQAEED
ncbi:MAG TPA: 4Fe-4S dicluster domain-containing protein, partial [Xanthomonadales bacterium]|nr:4Fe-4S dicluster domain-containing protein [Xanthomonadales bacterium]